MVEERREWCMKERGKAIPMPCQILEARPALHDRVDGEATCVREEVLHRNRKDVGCCGRWMLGCLSEKDVIFDGSGACKEQEKAVERD